MSEINQGSNQWDHSIGVSLKSQCGPVCPASGMPVSYLRWQGLWVLEALQQAGLDIRYNWKTRLLWHPCGGGGGGDGMCLWMCWWGWGGRSWGKKLNREVEEGKENWKLAFSESNECGTWQSYLLKWTVNLVDSRSFSELSWPTWGSYYPSELVLLSENASECTSHRSLRVKQTPCKALGNISCLFSYPSHVSTPPRPLPHSKERTEPPWWSHRPQTC